MKRRLHGLVLLCMFCGLFAVSACDSKKTTGETPAKTEVPGSGVNSYIYDPMGTPTATPETPFWLGISPTATPTALPEGISRPTPVVDTAEPETKVLGIPETTDASEKIAVEIFFGNPAEEGNAYFREHFPKLASIVDRRENTDGEFTEEEYTAFEKRALCPRLWFEEQTEQFFLKYPELLSRRGEGEMVQLILELTYPEMLRLAEDAQVVRIFPPTDTYYGSPYVQVVGTCDGKNVYDVTRRQYSTDYCADDGGSENLDYNLGRALSLIEDDEYLRIAYTIGLTDSAYTERMKESRRENGDGMSDEEWFDWLRGTWDGHMEVFRAQRTPDELYRFLPTPEWTILRHGEMYNSTADQIREMCPDAIAFDGEYHIVLTTKKQLLEFCPGFRKALCLSTIPSETGLDVLREKGWCLRFFWGANVWAAEYGYYEGERLPDVAGGEKCVQRPVREPMVTASDEVYDSEALPPDPQEQQIPENGMMMFGLGEEYGEVPEGNLMRIAFVLGPGRTRCEQLIRRYRAEYGASESTWDAWLASPAGQKELRLRMRDITEPVYESIRYYGFANVKEYELGEGRVPAGWDEGLTDGRVIVVETTRKKLEQFLPAIRNLAEGECYGSQESAWNWSANIFLRIYWQGAVDNLKTGDFAVN